jgi:hypothetical protein
MSQPALTANMVGMRQITHLLKKLAGPTQSVPAGSHVTIRHARPADTDALAVLAELDTSAAPRGATLVAEADGELWAAVSLDDNHLIANPFRPSGELAFRLLDRAQEVRRAARRDARRAAKAWPSAAPLGGAR